MSIIFFNSQSIVHKEFIPEGKTVNVEFYKGQMDCLLKCIQQVHPGLQFVDVAEIQEAVTDELKKVQKEEFSAAFQKVYDRAKASVCASGAFFDLKKNDVCLTHVFDF